MRLPAAIALCALFPACVSVPTPSGRPELKVRLPTSDTKHRIANGLSQNGMMVTSSDDLGVSAQKPTEPSMFMGAGSWMVRFNLTPIANGTQIRGTVFLQTATPQDVSGARGGHDFQRFLEHTFSDCMIDGPYIK